MSGELPAGAWVNSHRVNGFQTGIGMGSPIGGDQVEDLVGISLLLDGRPEYVHFVMSAQEALQVAEALADTARKAMR